MIHYSLGARTRCALTAVSCCILVGRSIPAQQPLHSARVDSARSSRPVPVLIGLDVPAQSVGSAIFTIDSTMLMGAHPTSFGEMLAARVPSLSVLRRGRTTSEADVIRLRAATSVVGTSTPLVVVDGIPIRADPFEGIQSRAGRLRVSRLNDLFPEDIERIHVLAGPAATALFGAGGARGAIVVVTRKGRTGPMRAEFWADGGAVNDVVDYPANYERHGISTSTGTPVASCTLLRAADGLCTPTTMDVWNPLEQANRLRTGHIGGAGLAVTGGLAGIRGFASLNARARTGILPDDDDRRLATRLRLSRQIGNLLELDAFGSYVRGTQRAPGADLVRAGLLGAAVDNANRGYSLSVLDTPGDRDLDRLSRGVRARMRPLGWVSIGAVVGRDEASQDEHRPFKQVPDGTRHPAEARSHWVSSNIAHVDASATWRGPLGARMQSILAYEDSRWKTVVSDSVTDESTLFTTLTARWNHAYSTVVQQRAAWSERVFVNIGARHSAGELFGISAPWHPSIDAAWLIGRRGAVDALRLRAAYAETGQSELNESVLSGAVPLNTTRPEKTHEWQVGLDADAWSRVQVTTTYFQSATPNLLVPGLPPGVIGLQLRLLNTGRMETRGFELFARARVLQRPTWTWDAIAQFTGLRNRLASLGEPAAAPSQAMTIGHPYPSHRGTPIRYVDVNGDGQIQSGEFLGTQDRVLLGSMVPSREASVRTAVVHRATGLSLAVAVDHRGGHLARDFMGELRCRLTIRCAAVNDPSAPFDDRLQAAGQTVVQIPGAYIENATFTRLREVALRWTFPPAWAARMGEGELSLEVRNLALWTSYGGIDPETDTARAQDATDDVAAARLPRELILRLQLAPGR